MNRHKSELSDEQWEKIAPFLPEPQASPWGGPNPSPIAPVSRASCGSCAAAPAGKTCPRRLCLWEEQEVWLRAVST